MYTQELWCTPRSSGVHPGALVYTQELRCTPRSSDVHPGAQMYTHYTHCWFTPKKNSNFSIFLQKRHFLEKQPLTSTIFCTPQLFSNISFDRNLEFLCFERSLLTQHFTVCGCEQFIRLRCGCLCGCLGVA